MRQFFPTEWQKSTGMSADGAPIGLCIGPLDALNIIAERDSLTAAGFVSVNVSRRMSFYLVQVSLMPEKEQR